NLDLLLAFALAVSFVDILAFARLRLDAEYWTMLDGVFTVITLLNVALVARALYRASRPEREEPAWRPHLRGRPLAALALALVVANVAVVLVREPDDAGYFTNLGAQRFRERGRLPYGDPLLTGTPGAAYGPVLYAAHVPFQVLLEPHSPNASSPALPLMGADATYRLPPPIATKLTTLALHLAGLFALWVVGRRLSGTSDVGWALVALYASSAFVLGVGGEREFIGGVTFISHIGPAAATLVAFACLPSPAWAGAMLAVATGAGFYPAFMLPAWVGYFWRDRKGCQRLLAGFALSAAIIGGATLALSRPAHGQGRVATILSDTFGHHTDPKGYGQSPFGFWGQREGVRRWLSTPTVGTSGLTTPAYGLFFGLVGASFFMARGRSSARLALLTAAIAFAASTIKVHSTGTYVAWAYPFLLIGVAGERKESGEGVGGAGPD
ncbi:MAG: hypothetical protein AB7Q29_18535, partial [Vicinamibacterales bacterium]